MTQETTEKIELEVIKYASTGARYRVWHGDQVIVANSKDPEHAAARALLDKGITGKLTTYSKDSDVPRMTGWIEKMAGFSIVEGKAVGLKRAKFREFDIEAEGPIETPPV